MLLCPVSVSKYSGYANRKQTKNGQCRRYFLKRRDTKPPARGHPSTHHPPLALHQSLRGRCMAPDGEGRARGEAERMGGPLRVALPHPLTKSRRVSFVNLPWALQHIDAHPMFHPPLTILAIH